MLTTVQLAELPSYRGRWAAIRLGTAPGNRAVAEEGVRLIYTAAGFQPPSRIVWTLGPLQIAREWQFGSDGAEAGPNLRSALLGRTRERAEAGLRRRLPADELRRVVAGLRHPVATSAAEAVERTMLVAARGARPPFVRRLAMLARALLGPTPRRVSFERAGIGPAQLEWIATMEYLHDACGLELELGPLRGFWLMAANSGWMVPHEHVCWLSERPTVLACDATGRLHSNGSPALAYADGWRAWFWKGNELPPVLMDRPAPIDLDDIDRETDLILRRCLIELMGPSRFLALGGATRISQDETGTLWRRTWPAGDSWAAVEVVNGSPEPDGSYRRYVLQVPPEMPTARAAVAWTYGLAEHQYRRLSLRT